MVIADLGIPPGFTVEPSAFEKMVADGRIDRYSQTARQITLYFGRVKPGAVETFGYELHPKYPIRVKTPKSEAYEYYTPDRRAEARPQQIEVTKP